MRWIMELMEEEIPEHLGQDGSTGGKWWALQKDAVLNETRVFNQLD